MTRRTPQQSPAYRALEADPAADLNPFGVTAGQARLSEPEITRTPESARRTCEPRPVPPDHQAEAAT